MVSDAGISDGELSLDMGIEGKPWECVKYLFLLKHWNIYDIHTGMMLTAFADLETIRTRRYLREIGGISGVETPYEKSAIIFFEAFNKMISGQKV